MLMSHGARSAGEIGWPKRGASAALAALTPSASAKANAIWLRVNMSHLAVGRDPPTGDGVAMLHGERRHVRRAAGRTALSNKGLAGRLDVAGLVDRTALQDDRPAIPIPRYA